MLKFMKFACKLLKDNNFKKKIRWNAQTREYETLYLNDLNQTKEEYEEFRKRFIEEHGYYPEDENGY